MDLNVSEKGFTLVELLVAMVLGLIVLGAVVGTFIIQNRHFTEQDQVVQMQESARNAMQLLINDLLMAGYNPTGTASVGFVAADTGSTSIRFRQDLNADADTDDSNEDVTYAFSSSKITRKSTAADSATPLVESIDSLTFVYFDANDAATTTPSEIRRVRVRLTAETKNKDRTKTLTSDVIPRNIGFQPAGAGSTVTETTTTTTTTTETSSSSTSSSSPSSSSSTLSSPSSSTSSSSSSSTSSSTSTAESSTTTSTAEGGTTTTTIPDTTGPAIASVTHSPDPVPNNTAVTICADVTDLSGVSTVNLQTNRHGVVGMTNTAGNTYCAVVSKQNNKTVIYSITAYDDASPVNSSTSGTYEYHQGG